MGDPFLWDTSIRRREVEECGRTKPWTGDEASGVVPRQWFI